MKKIRIILCVTLACALMTVIASAQDRPLKKGEKKQIVNGLSLKLSKDSIFEVLNLKIRGDSVISNCVVMEALVEFYNESIESKLTLFHFDLERGEPVYPLYNFYFAMEMGPIRDSVFWVKLHDEKESVNFFKFYKLAPNKSEKIELLQFTKVSKKGVALKGKPAANFEEVRYFATGKASIKFKGATYVVDLKNLTMTVASLK